MSKTVTWHGHANFQLLFRSGAESVNLLFDPFFSGNPKATTKATDIDPPDIVLVTHTHGDHVGDAADICIRCKALLATAVGMGDELLAAGVPAEQVLNGHGFNIGGSVAAKGVRIAMTHAFHTIAGVSPVGYVVTLPDGYTIYHAGDTGIFGDMALLGELYPIDLALLPAGGLYTMDKRQAAMAAKLLQAKAVIPMHWGTFPPLAQSMDDFADMLGATAPGCRCLVMRPGDSLSL
jgi:L-ascorbate metabolism protein UlaG (beta-lactamase superfamily)